MHDTRTKQSSTSFVPCVSGPGTADLLLTTPKNFSFYRVTECSSVTDLIASYSFKSMLDTFSRLRSDCSACVDRRELLVNIGVKP